MAIPGSILKTPRLVDSQPGVLITGVNPFEDLPGYQFFSMLRSDKRFRLEAADDSEAALAVIRTTGSKIHHLAHPGRDEAAFLEKVSALCEQRKLALVIPGADAHLFALARSESLASICPAAKWFARRKIKNKWDLQDWISTYLPVPRRWPLSPRNFRSWPPVSERAPVVVKGLRKGAARCESVAEISAAIRAILENPANQGSDGGAYFEEHVEGEEFCVVIVNFGLSTTVIGLRKLATTQAGTTLAATIENNIVNELNLARIAEQLDPGMALELELRRGQDRIFVFEGNLRLPSWMGALGSFGCGVLSTSIEVQLGRKVAWSDPPPSNGTLIYRLPQSGFLVPEEAFRSTKRRTGGKLLWPWASPHQFRVK